MPDAPSALDQLDSLLSEPLPDARLSSLVPAPEPSAPPAPGRRARFVIAGILAIGAVGFGLARIRPAADTSVADAPAPGATRAAEASVPCDAVRRDGREWIVGPDRPTGYAEARAWTETLPDCGGGWRVPTSSELLALYDPAQTAGTGHVERGRSWPAHVDPAFDGIGGGSWVWSDGSVSADDAPAVNLNQGAAVRLAEDDGFSVRAFAVRPAR